MLARMLTALALTMLCTAPVARAQDEAVIDNGSQAADLGNDAADRAVIQAPSQDADLGNDAADVAPIDDSSQDADLEGY